MSIIKKAVFPVAGLGTRFLPATKASPKEMLPVVDKPLIQYAVEEAATAGIDTMIFVTGRNKSAIENHFDLSLELESELIQKNKKDLLKIVQDVAGDKINFIYTRQREAKGLGHAVLCAEKIVGDEPFAVLLADDLVYNDGLSATAQMVRLYQKYKNSIIATEEVQMKDVSSYGIVSGKNITDDLLKLDNIIEKPAIEKAPSNLAVIGRYILNPSIFKYLQNTKKGAGGEIQLTDAIAEQIKNENVLACKFKGIRYDCGSKFGFLKANIEYGIRHPQTCDDLKKYLQQL
ncbi:MAG: UTP--glucose-1-phosphate uridylyltransferase [Gammaproteobacteria bacterium]|nr:MAG: UTP--glucose-1-phosphate uridylyltransferase [Gammaproteobacteria bacterium]